MVTRPARKRWPKVMSFSRSRSSNPRALPVVHIVGWLRWALALLVASLTLFALPSGIEGPVLVRISSDHAIAVLDAVAIVPLLVASALLYGGVWRGRNRLRDLAGRHPGSALAFGVAGGFGLGLLLASVFSGFTEWWALGAVILTAVVVAAGFSVSGG